MGLGQAGTKLHLPAIAKATEARLVSVCDSDEHRCQAVTRANGLHRYYTDFSHMLAEESLDCVHICTPPQSHAALAKMAIEAGCHVVIEKPMALEMAQADEMVSLAQKKKVKLTVIHNLLSSPPFLKAKSLVDGNKIGDLTSVHAIWGSPSRQDDPPWTRGMSGGLIGEIIPHPLYLILALIGPVERMSVMAGQGNSEMPCTEVMAQMQGRRAMASLSMTVSSPRPAELYVCGTRSSLCLTFGPGWSVMELPRGEMSAAGIAHDLLTELTRTGKWWLLWGGMAADILTHRWRIGHDRQIKQFYRSLRGEGQPVVSAQEALEVTRVYCEILSHLPVLCP